MDIGDFNSFETKTLLECGHDIAYCASCRASWQFAELCASVNLEEGTADRFLPGNLCPTCGDDLSLSIAEHIEVCDNFVD